jgi:sulfur carrier protein
MAVRRRVRVWNTCAAVLWSGPGGGMRLTINGEDKVLEQAEMSVGKLVEELGLGTVRVAVELNRAIVRRAQWEETPVTEGDVVEIVQFVGGGA